MTVRINIIGAIFMAALFIGRVQAQEALLKAAQHHYESLSYIKAIDAYESALAKKGLTEQQKLDARIKLADSYTKIKDTQNAERIYRKIFEGSTGELSDDKVAPALKSADRMLEIAAILVLDETKIEPLKPLETLLMGK